MGCPKNLVNSEEMLALLDQAGYPTTADPARAAAVIINTCAFIDDAKSEAIERILETAALRAGQPGAEDPGGRLPSPAVPAAGFGSAS